MRWEAWIVLGACLGLAGCGGGQVSGVGAGQGSVHTASVGIATLTYHGRFVPASAFSQGGVTATSIAGVSLSNVTLNPAPKPENAVLLFEMGDEIFVLDRNGQRQITTGQGFFESPTISKTGLVVFYGRDYESPFTQIFACNLDGSNFHRITSSPMNHLAPSVSPSGTKIVFQSDSHDLYTVSASGTEEAPFAATNQNLIPDTLSDASWSPDGSRIAFDGLDKTFNRVTIFVVPADGGTATELALADEPHFSPKWSPDGHLLVFTGGGGSGNNIDTTDVRATDGSYFSRATAPSGLNYENPCFNPDGASITFQSGSQSVNSIVTQLTGDTTSLTSLVSHPTSGSLPEAPFWSPFFGPKAFVGTGGLMSSASGFIWGQLGDGFGGFAALAATTATSMTITQQPAGGSGGPLVYLAKADKITKIVYSNSYFGAYNAVTPTNSKQALISVSTVTGQVDTVAPLAEPGLTSSTRGGLAYDGKFAAIYDSKGKNLASSGASHIELDSKSGAVASWH
ncbi:MAG TPA: hypothetical protein VG944_10375 [Fimbriimonas sp.]|nr:hypothetical protein [Fimbriimonas sp.]